MSPALVNTIGLAANLAGVILLFRYGMPYHIETQGHITLTDDDLDQAAINAERWYRRLGWCGLVLIFIGTGFQATSSWMP